MKSKNEDVNAIRRRVEKKFDERRDLLTHGIAYAAVNIMLWVIWLLEMGGFPWPMFVTLFWGIGIFGHYIDYYNKHGKGAQKREAQIEAEIERQLALERARAELGSHERLDEDLDGADVYTLDDYEKRGLRLSDDGELVNMPAEDEDYPERREQERR